MHTLLRESILPIYSEALQNIPESLDVWPFCVQIGDEYHLQEFKMLFIGKSINGGLTNSRNIAELFGDCEKTIFGNQNPMKWVVEEKRGKKEYNPKRSAFWRLIRKISTEKIGEENWYNKIACSNLYKFSPKHGNPNDKLKDMQLAICKKILYAEINVLKPDVVFFLTSGWEKRFIDTKEEKHKEPDYKIVDWKSGRKDYITKGWNSSNCIYVTTFHPERKNTDNHKKAILEIVNHFKSNNV